MITLDEYRRQSRWSDPGPYAALLDPLPSTIPQLTTVVRNLVVHYVASGERFAPDRLAEIDLRWIARRLAVDQDRFDAPLARPRPVPDRVAGCCRDFTLTTVAALRHHGVPARSRVGFAGYFLPDFHVDHVVVEHWNGARWIRTDAQLDPAAGWPFDPADLPRPVVATPEGEREGEPGFATAAQVWTAYRRGEVDPDRYGVSPHLPLRGPWFLRNYVLHELAHRQRDELLLWDNWGAMSQDPDAEVELVDEIATLLLAADGDGDAAAAERELSRRYAADERLRPIGEIVCHSPTGSVTTMDLTD
ncbi:transglutaminase-like domain-containing protein [Solwaraspora sp. WMMD406]|uniref:transglutaminase-like domain-containing protein n=1 Tax=Solwaraspora sp. WMMD406 TaxID=3016095 RepID=UPI002417D23A|nr:transglutaminase-like domain-containing protein [Solwaraspora sp. WMMD406]MDG4767948.1 transglutaminase-like domain-containing protein [Solwaraspora sp. WMMD406]